MQFFKNAGKINIFNIGTFSQGKNEFINSEQDFRF